MSDAEVRQSFLKQASACEALGSPFTARLCRLLALKMSPASPVEAAILGWPGDPSSAGDAVALRLAGSLHALVLSRADEDLASVYPPNESDDENLWHALSNALRLHQIFILDRLKSAPQTNEVRRSAALLPGFLTIAAMLEAPLRLLEVGTSAGLNLQWDRYAYRLGETVWGNLSSPVQLAPEWSGPAPPDARIEVAERAACDLNPLDPSSPDDRLRLLSYIWADQSDRLERTRAALALAADTGQAVTRADAVTWLRRQLEKPASGMATVVYHSVAWQYLPSPARDEGEAIIAAAGNRATQDAPLCRLQMEADGKADGAALSLQVWPTGEIREIGRVDFHGRWVKWRGW